MILEELKKYIPNYLLNSDNNKILLAFSGGLDSCVLLHALNIYNNEFKIDLSCLHINYQQHENSNIAEEHCRQTCNKYNNKFISVKSEPIIKNFEHNARIYRYNKLINYSNKNNINIILTAHHLDDQIETIYMKVKNNSDWVSKVGIRSEYGKIKRPLLNIQKSILFKYSKTFNIKFVKDLSNNNINYLRNDIRINQLPKMRISRPNIDQELIEIKNKSLKKLEIFNKNISNYNTLYLKDKNTNFIKVDNEVSSLDLVQFKLYYNYLIKHFFSIQYNTSKKHWKQIKKIISNSASGSIININKNHLIIKDRKCNYIISKKYFIKIKNIQFIDIEKFNHLPFNWNNNTFLDYVEHEDNYTEFNISKKLYNKGDLYIRCWKNGDKCYSKYYNKNIKLKNIFINNKLSLIDKYTMPIIINKKNEILCIPKLYNNFNKEDDCKKIFWKKYND